MENKPIKGTNFKSDTITQLERKKTTLQAQKDKLTIKVLEIDQQISKIEQQIRKSFLDAPRFEGGDINLHYNIPPRKNKK